MSSDSEPTQTVTDHSVIQASERAETELILNGVDAVHSVTIEDVGEQERAIGMVQFLVTIDSVPSEDIETEIETIRSLAILTSRAEIDHKLNTDLV